MPASDEKFVRHAEGCHQGEIHGTTTGISYGSADPTAGRTGADGEVDAPHGVTCSRNGQRIGFLPGVLVVVPFAAVILDIDVELVLACHREVEGIIPFPVDVAFIREERLGRIGCCDGEDEILILQRVTECVCDQTADVSPVLEVKVDVFV